MAFRLERLRSDLAIVGALGRPSTEFQQWWQTFAETIEAQEAAQDALLKVVQSEQARLTGVVADLAIVVDELGRAQDEIERQLGLILKAQETADKVALQNAISASYIAPSNVLTATDAGDSVTVSVADFTRHYDDGTSVNVEGAELTGRAYDVMVAVYYDDPTRKDETPEIKATQNLASARHNTVPGRHYVGEVRTPVAGGGTTTGGSTPPGGGEIPSRFPNDGNPEQ